jgi:polygalacturonase
VRLDNVQLTDSPPATYTYTANFADITLGPGASNLEVPATNDTVVTGTPAKGPAASCTEKFVPFPEQ